MLGGSGSFFLVWKMLKKAEPRLDCAPGWLGIRWGEGWPGVPAALAEFLTSPNPRIHFRAGCCRSTRFSGPEASLQEPASKLQIALGYPQLRAGPLSSLCAFVGFCCFQHDIALFSQLPPPPPPTSCST